MKKFFLYFLFLASSLIHADESMKVKLLGEVLSPTENNTLNEKYYFIFNETSEDGSKTVRAYPIANKDKKTLEFIEQNKGKLIFIHAKTVVQKKQLNEIPMDVTYLEIDDLKTVELKDIKTKATDPNQPDLIEKNYSQKSDRPVIQGVDDTVTNTLIFTGAALMLGRALLGF